MIANESFVNATVSFVNSIKKTEFSIGSFICAKENLVTANGSVENDIRSCVIDQKLFEQKRRKFKIFAVHLLFNINQD